METKLLCREDGTKFELHTYYKGILNGIWKTWFQNGQLAHEGMCRYGSPVGMWKSWDRDGTLLDHWKA